MATLGVERPCPQEGKRKYREPIPIPDYLQDEPPFVVPDLPGSKFEDEVPIIVVSRAAWGARPPLCEVPMRFPICKIKFSSEDIYKRDEYLSGALQKTQAYYMDELKEPDVPFNFLVDEGGLIYEGRGWAACPRFTGLKGENILEIAFVGDYSGALDPPTFAKCDAAHSLIMRGIRQQMVDPQFSIVSMKDRSTVSPDDMKWFPNHDDDYFPDDSPYIH